MERRSLSYIDPSSFLLRSRAAVALLVHWRSRKRKVGWWYGLFFVCLTLVNLWVQMFSTTACLSYSPSMPCLPGILDFLKVSFLYLFLADFVLRVWSASERSEYREKSWPSVRYLCRRWTVIDLLSVGPLFIPGMPTYFSIFRVARIARLFTLFSSRRLLQGREHIRRAIISSQGVIITVSVLLSLLIFAMGVGMYLVESQVQPDKFTSIPDGLWWALVTIATVGYGDLVPVTELGRVLTLVFLIVGLFMAVSPAAKIAASFVRIVEQEETHRLWLMRLRVSFR